jgi:hypothetical protein
MVKAIEATFDGKVFRPSELIPLEPNTRVRLTVETMEISQAESMSFLDTARQLNLDGPSDWSANVEEYLYGGENSSAK